MTRNLPTFSTVILPMGRRLFLSVVFLAVSVSRVFAAQPTTQEIFPLDELKPGQPARFGPSSGALKPEPFAVEVTGVVPNALGPGKSLILCQLTDPRVQHMGAVAGMSGSPLYIDGKLAGALSYQIQRFETVRHAGFTPAADLVEVQTKMAAALNLPASPSHRRQTTPACARCGQYSP